MNMATKPPPPKRIKKEQPPEAAAHTNHHVNPKSLVTWNCNGLTSRASINRGDLERLLQETKRPDLLCMQEVRLKALNANQRGIPIDSPEFKATVKPILSELFHEYKPLWSLASTKYAGTLTLVHKRLSFEPSANTVAFTTDSAVDLLLKRFHLTREQVGLSKHQQGQPLEKKQKQTSMTLFFAPKNKNVSKLQSINSLPHTDEGRFQFLAFPDLDVIQTYVPNNGNKQESFARRKLWDENMKQFLIQRKTILKQANQERPLLWCGDFNVAKEYLDGTHWSNKVGSAGVYEWWTDESVCFVTPPPDVNTRSKDYSGMPSFTPGERRRFQELIDAGGLVDVWRELHPNGVSSLMNKSLSTWELPNYTWRGHKGKDGNIAKYQGRGQRLDYFLLSSNLLQSVESCDILGYGEQHEGLFCGSDHCALQLKFA